MRIHFIREVAVVAFLIFGQAALAQPASSELPVVFFIHGYGGKPESFCDFPMLLTKLDQPFEVKTLKYTTQDQIMQPAHFVEQIHEQIKTYYNDNKFPDTKPYAFVTHSQGGIVGLKYIEYCLLKNRSEFCKKGPTQLTHLITLGTPFWGSPTASRMKDYQILSSVDLLPAGQLHGLAFGSLSNTMTRDLLVRPSNFDSNGQWQNPLPPQLQIYNFAGDVRKHASQLKGLSSWALTALSNSDLEYDLVVDLGSARTDFLFYLENPNLPKVSYRGQTQMVQHYTPMSMLHVPAGELPGLACVKDVDVATKNPQADIFKMVKSVLLNSQPGSVPIDMKKLGETHKPQNLGTFNVEIKAILPLGYHRKLLFNPKTPFKITGMDSEIVQSTINNTLVNKYSGENKDLQKTTMAHFHNFYHTGKMKASESSEVAQNNGLKTATLSYRLSVPGWKAKEFNLQVAPTYSSYAQVLLVPDLPLKATPPKSEPSAQEIRDIPVCYIGQTGQISGVNKNGLFSSFNTEQFFNTLPTEHKVVVYLRSGLRRQQSNALFESYDRDRYYARISGNFFAWLNVPDVDLIEKVPCASAEGSWR